MEMKTNNSQNFITEESMQRPISMKLDFHRLLLKGFNSIGKIHEQNILLHELVASPAAFGPGR